jgi:hypothetical protein
MITEDFGPGNGTKSSVITEAPRETGTPFVP